MVQHVPDLSPANQILAVSAFDSMPTQSRPAF